MPEELAEQIPLVHKYIELLGRKHIQKLDMKLMILLVFMLKKHQKDVKVEIYSSDRDLLQLVDENITLIY